MDPVPVGGDPRWAFKDVVDPRDPDLPALADLLRQTLADPNIVLGLDRFREFVAGADGQPRVFHALVARAEDDSDRPLLGTVVFSYVPATGCGFSEYIAVARAQRRQGLGRALFDTRRAVLDADAQRVGQPACRGLFIEVENPDRTPPAFLEAERRTALDAVERLRVFDHLGFRRVDVPYVQPPLGPGQEAVTYMDLLFAPWDARVAAAARLPAPWVAETVRPIWAAWAPTTYQQPYTHLLAHLRSPRYAAGVPLQPLFQAALSPAST